MTEMNEMRANRVRHENNGDKFIPTFLFFRLFFYFFFENLNRSMMMAVLRLVEMMRKRFHFNIFDAALFRLRRGEDEGWPSPSLEFLVTLI